MPQITDAATIEKRTFYSNCSPRFEAIIAQKYIGSIWAYSDEEGTVFDATVNQQFVGVMHEGTLHQSTWTETTCGFIEDGEARRGDLISNAVFTDFSEALDHLIAETKRLTIEIFGGLEAEMLAV